MNKQKIIDLLMGYSLKENINKPIIYYYRREQVEQFASYIIKLENERDRYGKLKNPWLANRTEEEMAELFRRVAEDGLVFDGKHITLQPTGISYDYIAYKNKMLYHIHLLNLHSKNLRRANTFVTSTVCVIFILKCNQSRAPPSRLRNHQRNQRSQRNHPILYEIEREDEEFASLTIGHIRHVQKHFHRSFRMLLSIKELVKSISKKNNAYNVIEFENA